MEAKVAEYPPDIVLPVNHGNCQYCHKPSMHVCSVCKAWYCSFTCIRLDWPKHKLECTMKTVVFTQDGNMLYKSEDISDFINQKNSFQRENNFGRNHPANQNNENRRQDNRRNQPNDMKRQSANYHQSKNRSSLSEHQSDTDSTRTSDMEGRQNPNNSFKKKSQNGARGMFKNNHPKTANKHGFGNRNQPAEPTVVIKKPDSDKDDYQKAPSPAQKKTLPIPTNLFTEVYISNIEGSTYWVYKKENLVEQERITTKLMEYCNDPKVVSDPNLMTKCCAPFAGAWYRAKILSKSDKSAKVLFIDFGNECEIQLNEMKRVPKDLISIKPLSFKIKFVEGTPNTETFEVDQLISIKAVKMENDHCEVQIKGGPGPKLESEAIVPSDDASFKKNLPISSVNFVPVKIVVTEQPDEYWVVLEDDFINLCKIGCSLNVHSSVTIAEPVLNETYVVKYDSVWCRAKVTNLNPLTVFYIDYGNSDIVKLEELHPMPINLKNIPPMAIKIKLAKGTPSEYTGLENTNILNVKAVKAVHNGMVIVHVAGVIYPDLSEEPEAAIPRRPNSDQTVKKRMNHVIYLTEDNATNVMIEVRKVMNENCITGSIVLNVDEHNMNILKYMTNDKIHKLLSNSKPNLNFKPSLGDVVSAKIGRDWYRGYIMVKHPGKIKVALTDYGLVVVPDALSPLPQEVKSIAESSVRCIFSTPVPKMSELIGEKFKLCNIKKEVGKLIGELDKYGNVEIFPWEPLVEDAGLNAVKLASGSKVYLSSFHSPHALYVRSAEHSDLLALSELLQDVAGHCQKTPSLDRKPWCGEFLCCRFSEDGNYYRAQVFRKIGDKYQVNFVDYGNIETVSLQDMKPLTDSLKAVPSFAVKVGLKGIPGSIFNRDAIHILNEIALNEVPLHLTYSKSLGEVTLTMDTLKDGSEVNEMIHKAMLPTWLSKNTKNYTAPFMVTDVRHEKWEIGQKLKLMVVVASSHKQLLVINEESPVFGTIMTVVTPKINEYCNQGDEGAYNPRLNEICLAKYKDEETADVSWYRAICTQPQVNSSHIFFIDFGNYGEVYHKDIRKMPPDFMDEPAVLKSCRVYGLSDNLPDNTKELIKSSLENNSISATVIEDYEDGSGVVFVPEVNKILQQNGLPLINPQPVISEAAVS
ncbi:tudor domain-containing protein 1 isoform X2 [Cimex lectularius]|uniref:Tudor domain-containing protein 1 n=1 Tax=Cimex lectularius TaxID=79782 RepID=A0A8I6S9X3_CIMLE|nr:tudor domain-containing protein 1 isoform X2 [Cimex lectularius]